MPCNWSRATNFLRSTAHLHNPALIASCRAQILRNNLIHRTRHGLPILTSNKAFYSTAKTLPNDATPLQQSHLTTENPQEVELSSFSELTTPQVSRAVAQAVRAALQDGTLRDAFYLVNSVRHSERASKQPSIRAPNQIDLINFGRAIPSRLAAHTLLHGLIRLGLSHKAIKQAELMMNDSIQIRTSTLQAIMQTLLPKTLLSNVLDYSRTPNNAKVLTLSPAMASARSTRLALMLLFKARHHRHQRTRAMFQSLISACILQGELIVGSLLFVLLVKDWQLRSAAANAAQTIEASCNAQLSGSGLNRNPYQVGPYFEREFLNSITHAIDKALSQEPRNNVMHPSFQHALQSLANLAMALDDRLIPTSYISSLIRSLYSCPKVKETVWIQQNGRARRVHAYAYFHGVLMRLINGLPSVKPRNADMVSRRGSMLPPLNTPSYNALLHYALRHQLSPTFAQQILHHMTVERENPLTPDITTYNILIRSGTLLRRNDISDKALEMLRQVKDNASHGIMVYPSPSNSETDGGTPSSVLAPIDPKGNKTFLVALQRLKNQPFDLPAHLNITDEILINADSTTLSAYVTHLTSTGNPHIVADIIFHLIPELSIIDHPSWGSVSPEDRLSMHLQSRKACIERAVSLGPYFFTTVLNAMRKAGKTGLVERVWLLAKEAERASWVPEFSDKLNIKPWCLPVHAYTTMIQCYAAEAQKSTHMRTRDDGSTEWVPRSKQFVQGWARFVLRRKKFNLEHRTRAAVGRKLGVALFLSMKDAARNVYDTLMEMARSKQENHMLHKHMQMPLPDPRFFNAALDIFTREPYNRSSFRHKGRVYWRYQLRRGNRLYAHQGSAYKYWDPLLQQVAEEILAAGFSVPPGLRRMFIGRWTPGSLQWDHRRQLDRGPHMFPPVNGDVFRPFSLPVWRSRGLPIRRRWRARGRERTRTSQ